MQTKKYALQHKKNGQLVDIYDETSVHMAKRVIERNDYLELIELSHTSHVQVYYAEPSGPWGYGHEEVSFETYGSIKKCIRNLYKWMQSTISVFGPDARDIRDYFKYCTLDVNGIDKTDWIRKQSEKLTIKEIYV